MLQQILQDMFIDPELLAELSDEQKQILFIKMREEQVKRWEAAEEKLEADEKRAPRKKKPGKKKVDWKLGKDDNVWVWVMGDHNNDKPIEQLLEEEAQQEALIKAEKEMMELSLKEEQEMKQKLQEEQMRLEEEKSKKEQELRRKQEEAALYQSLKEAKLAAQKLDEEKRKTQEQERKRIEELRQRACRKCEEIQNSFANEKRRSLERNENEKRRRSNELYTLWKEMRKQIEKSAEESSKEVDNHWQEQEKRAKKAQEQLRNLAKRAREEHRNSMLRTPPGEKPPLPPKPKSLTQNNNISASQNGTAVVPKVNRKRRTPRPTCKEAVVTWFLEEEKPQGVGIDPKTNTVAPWFHGVISRVDAEKQLLTKTLGTYLVRVSERVWGYTISYRAEDRCKHFLIDTSEAGYQFFGENQVLHGSLNELIEFHKTNPITVIGGEKLLHPCGQTTDPPDYSELLGRIAESTAL